MKKKNEKQNNEDIPTAQLPTTDHKASTTIT